MRLKSRTNIQICKPSFNIQMPLSGKESFSEKLFEKLPSISFLFFQHAVAVENCLNYIMRKTVISNITWKIKCLLTLMLPITTL